MTTTHLLWRKHKHVGNSTDMSSSHSDVNITSQGVSNYGIHLQPALVLVAKQLTATCSYCFTVSTVQFVTIPCF